MGAVPGTDRKALARQVYEAFAAADRDLIERLLADDFEFHAPPDPQDNLTREYHKRVKKVTEDIEAMRFNTALSALMEFSNEAHKAERLPRALVEGFVLLL